jgi:hypothetical protein
VREKGRKGQYGLVFGAMVSYYSCISGYRGGSLLQDTVEDLTDADIREGYNELSRVVVNLYKGRWYRNQTVCLGSSTRKPTIMKHAVQALGTIYEKDAKLGVTIAYVASHMSLYGENDLSVSADQQAR